MMKINTSLFVFILFIIASCHSNKQKNTNNMQDSSKNNIAEMPVPAAFDTMIDGKAVHLFILKNEHISVAITNYGARVVSLIVPDKNGKLIDIAIGYDSIKPYTEGNDTYFGAIAGRYANRIAKGKFSLEGNQYTLATNNGLNHLHGGNKGFSRVVWDAKKENDSTLILKYFSKDGEEGYPGNLQVSVTYTVTKSSLEINYEATTDKNTIINLTNHTYFNLNGAGSGKIDGHLLMINANEFTPIDSTLIPTGELKNVRGTPFDFHTLTAIGTHINDSANQQILYGKGFDHNFVLAKSANSFDKCAEVIGDQSGIKMDVWTTEPGLQFYSGNFMDGTHVLKNGFKDQHRTAFCLETQHFPDSPNETKFPSTVLKPGEVFRSKTEYVFGIKN